MNSSMYVLAFCLFGFCVGDGTQSDAPHSILPSETIAAIAPPRFQLKLPEVKRIGSGAYLSSRFAQQQQDWKTANTYIGPLLDNSNGQDEILRRAMILAMGAGDTKKAIDLAKKINKGGDIFSRTVADIFLITDAMARNDNKESERLIKALPTDNSITSFVKPFLEGWNNASQGKLKVSSLRENTIQLYHAILISDFLKDNSAIETLFGVSALKDSDNPADLERIADLYAHSGLKDKAIKIYERVLKEWPEDENIKEKIKDVKAGANKPMFEKVTSANHGMATAFHDIASVLYRDYNDESARIFANLAIMLAPDMSEPKFLLAQISARHNQFDDAIAFYNKIGPEDKNAVDAKFKISELLEDSGRIDEALEILHQLEKTNDSIDVQIGIGDFYRRQEDFKSALTAYENALNKIGSPTPAEYWGIHYARGICYEQLKKWPEAEKELLAALELSPDHPQVLNYIGYGWAERGEKLDQALAMITRAAELRPDDGYIVDSLGWVLFRLGKYEEAIPYLEKSVALLPYDPTINDHLGDAYWMVNRKREARFQWTRAKNNSDEQELISAIDEKLIHGPKVQDHLIGENKP